ncbi:MAG: hypothetical protein ACRC8K_12600 [Waterburya sp.]
MLQANLRRSLITILITLATTQSAFAETFSQYCISQKRETSIQKKSPESSLTEDLPPPVTLSQNNQTFTIAVDPINNLKLLLQPENKQQTTEEITLPVDEGGSIVNLVLGKDNWLWVDRTVIDYLIEVKVKGETAYFNPPKELPELHTEPCSVIKKILRKCEIPRNSYYSTTLSRAFASGYPHQGWGRKKYRHFEFISGEEKPVPEALAKADFVADVPQWHGALFREPSGEALLYDGTTVTNVSDDFLELEQGETFQDWEVETTLSGRTFLGKFFGRFPDEPLFLLEPQKKPYLKPIYLPSQLEKGWLKVFTMPSDPQSNLWIITGNRILTEVNQKIQIVANIPASSIIHNYDSVEQLADGTISLIIKNEISNSASNYFLRKFSSPEECEIMFKPG